MGSNNIGSVGELTDNEDFDSYVERVELFFDANNVVAARQLPSFLSLIGAQAYQTLKSLTSPSLPKAKTFKECVDKGIQYLKTVDTEKGISNTTNHHSTLAMQRAAQKAGK